MVKRGNGEGSISKRSGGGWMAQYYVLSGTGGRERRTLYARTRTEAARKLARVIGERDTGFVVDAGKLTVGDYLERWLKDSVKGTVRTSTYEAYRYMVEPHLVPFLGALKLRDINPVHVRALYREKLEAGLSAATVRKMHAVLNKAMKQAVMDGLVHRNVCDAVRPPRLVRKEIRPLDPEQAVVWCTRAAEAGSARAMANLGGFYATGRGVAQDDALALAWYEKAANAGHGRAAATLGVMHATGQGAPHAIDRAKQWFNQAGDLGFDWQSFAESVGVDIDELFDETKPGTKKKGPGKASVTKKTAPTKKAAPTKYFTG